MAYESEVKRSCDIRTAIEQAEAQLQKLRQDLEASAASLVPFRKEKDKDAQALGLASQKLLALEATFAAKDRPNCQG